MTPPPRKPRVTASEKLTAKSPRRAARPEKPREASDDTAPTLPEVPPRPNPQATRKEKAEAVRKKVIAKLKRLHPMD